MIAIHIIFCWKKKHLKRHTGTEGWVRLSTSVVAMHPRGYFEFSQTVLRQNV